MAGVNDAVFRLKGYPNPRQEEFFASRARHTAYGGARGGGKSWAMRRKLVLMALRYEDLQLLLLRRTLPELNENHVRPLQTELSGFVDYNQTHRVFTFPNGSRTRTGKRRRPIWTAKPSTNGSKSCFCAETAASSP